MRDRPDRLARAGSRAAGSRGKRAGIRAPGRASLHGRTGRCALHRPLSKQRVALGERGFVGHTEYLAALTGARVAMMMAGPRLRVVLATNHLSLAEETRSL